MQSTARIITAVVTFRPPAGVAAGAGTGIIGLNLRKTP